jgi:programmed cell death protein 4
MAEVGEDPHGKSHKKVVLRGGAVKKSVAKKDGAGGAGTWGKPGVSDLKATGVLGDGDPNFDDDSGAAVLMAHQVGDPAHDEKQRQKAIIHDLILELIESGDIAEVLEEIKGDAIIEGVNLVKKALLFGLEHKAYERELISQLLSEAHPIFEGSGYEEGFQAILSRLPDLVLDVPNAAEYLGLFIARAVFDDALPPSFIKSASFIDNPLADQALALAFNTYNNNSERHRLENIWGTANLASVERLQQEVDSILREYANNPDLTAAELALKDLESPSFMSQVVRQILSLAIEAPPGVTPGAMSDLLEGLVRSGLVADFYVQHGFNLAWKNIEDLKLDVPQAESLLRGLQDEAIRRGILTEDFVVSPRTSRPEAKE